MVGDRVISPDALLQCAQEDLPYSSVVINNIALLEAAIVPHADVELLLCLVDEENAPLLES